MATHSRDSSLEDDYYYPYTHSASSSLSSVSAAQPLPALHPIGVSQSTPPSSQVLPAQSFVRKQTSLAQIAVPSFSAFRSQASSIPISSSPIATRRKPLPLAAHASKAASVSLTETGSPRFAEPTSRPFSVDSPLPVQSSDISLPVPEAPGLDQSIPRVFPDRRHTRTDSIDSRIIESNPSSSIYGGDESRRSSIPIHTRYAEEHHTLHAPKQSVSSLDFGSIYSPAQRLSTISSMNGTQAPEMKLELDGVQRTFTDESIGSAGDSPNHSRPRSPGAGRFGGIFGWKANSKQSSSDSPTTTFSDRSLSPLASPGQQKLHPMDHSIPGARLTPPGLDIQKANASSPRREYFDNPDSETPILIGTPETNAHVRELEHELEQVSSELAASVKREMDLEDEVDRLRMEQPMAPASDTGRRGSDYFSDSGASSARFPITDMDSKLEQMERSLRKAEQEKAQVKVEMASRLQTELSRRRDLEQMVQRMEEQLQKRFDEEDERGDAEDRIDELESTIEDSRRLLSQERQAKGSLEDLYRATRHELESHKNEADNLREEIVPQLRARVEGLESEAADTQALMYENTRMQQELALVKGAAKVHGRFGSIAEEERVKSPTLASFPRMGLSRSGSLARSTSKRGGSLTRSGSVSERTDGKRQRSGSLGADAVKDMEDQRDALHRAVKMLITRCEKQQRDHERAIRKLTNAKTRAEHSSPNRGAYHKEVTFLKDEVSTLRKRTEDALEQKWQYEKGLSGIKMDLDRAELETRGLRIILQERDIFATSTRVQMNEDSPETADDKLQLSISTAEAERDQARQIAQQYRTQALQVEDDSATELTNSARRMDELADQLDKEVQSNVQLRTRLSDAVARGEREQKESNGKITEMQKRLTIMEDSVLTAQQHSETTLYNHEAEVRRLEEASSPALQRLRISIPDGQKLQPPKSPLLSINPKSPKLGIGSKKLSETSLLEMSRTQMLERKVRELEGLLKEAEDDMQDVVQTVNKSQIEVAELQTERDAAMSQMRKLQALIVAERERAEALMP